MTTSQPGRIVGEGLGRNHVSAASFKAVRHTRPIVGSVGGRGMIDSRSDGQLDHDLARLRREWVAAYREWGQVAGDKSLTSTRLNEEQRAALRRYRAAETAYFTRLYMATDRQPGE